MEQDNSLFRASPETYGPDYKHHLLEQYKLFVESADHISQRRTSANNYLLTVNAFLVTLYGLAASLGSNRAWVFVVPVAGILVCITWLVLIRSYRDLNTAKFKVIHELEQQLPTALFDREWDHAQRGQGKAYRPLTHIEPYIPAVFAALYVGLTIYAVFVPPSQTGSPASLPLTSMVAPQTTTTQNTASGPAVSSMNQEVIRTWVAIAQGVATTLAIFIGGWWAYTRFIRQREGAPRANIKHATQFKRLSEEKTLLRITVSIRNNSSVLLKWNDGILRVQKMLPCSAKITQWLQEQLDASNDTQLEADWPLLSERVITKQSQEIEPGETDATHFDFILDNDVETVLIYSHISNATKLGIGWNRTSVHDVNT